MLPRRSCGDPAAASIERFDPYELRCEVLRRFAQERAQASTAWAVPFADPPSVGLPRGAGTLREPAVSSGAGPRARQILQRSATAPAAEDSGAGNVTRPLPQAATEPSQVASAAAAAGAAAAEGAAAAPARGTPSSFDGAPQARADDGRGRGGGGRRTMKQVVVSAWSNAKRCALNWVQNVKIFVYLGFPQESLFLDPCVEELYQRHHMQHWSPRVDWSAVALLQMLLWDVAANPPYRLSLVLHFYGCFAASVALHRLLFLATRDRPWRWRATRGVLLCGFLLGRGVVCHPLLSEPPTLGASTSAAAEAEESIRGVRAASSLIGLGMTNLSAVLGLQLHTFDTLLLCVAHNLACTCWAILALHMPLGGSWHMLVTGHSLVACVCIWQQHEQERYDRSSFEQEMLMERGILLRSSDCIVRQGAQADFPACMRLLFWARCAEHLNF